MPLKPSVKQSEKSPCKRAFFFINHPNLLSLKPSHILPSPLKGNVVLLSLPSPLRGRRKENNPVNCFLTTGAELLICDPATATKANVTVSADRSKLVLPFLQHLRSQTDQGEGDNQPSMYSPPKILGGVRGGFIHHKQNLVRFSVLTQN